MGKLVSSLAALAAAAIVYSQIGIFVIQPIGALPEGKTLIIWRESAILRFVDSADGICARLQNGVSLLCRGVTLGAIAKNNAVIARLPYSGVLYSISTGGVSYGS